MPATRRYCAGDFKTWDPKITTFPGLYVLGAAYAWAASALLGWLPSSGSSGGSSGGVGGLGAGLAASRWCDTAYLRSLNALLLAAAAQLAHAASYELQRRAWRRQRQRQRRRQRRRRQEQQQQQGRQSKQQQQQQQEEEQTPARATRRRAAAAAVAGEDKPAAADAAAGNASAAAAAAPSPEEDAAMRRGALAVALLAGALLPTHAFFAALYYTDVGALAALLLAQLLLLRRAHGAAALAAAGAVGMRQTNAVFATLMIGGAVLEELLEAAEAEQQEGQRQQRDQDRDDGSGDSDDGFLATAAAELAAALPQAWRSRRALLARFWAPLLVPAAFAAFVWWNGGVTVGDREAHAPARHWAHPFYFGSFALAAAGPLLLAPAAGGGLRARLASAARAPRAEAGALALALAASVAAVAAGTVAHPYLLADNRHYTFYVWRRVIDRTPWARFALAPLHAAGWRLLLGALRASQRALWVAAFAAGVGAALAPAALLEPRYFTPALALALLHLWQPLLLAGGGSGGSGGGSGGSGRSGKGAAAAAAAAAARRDARLNAAALRLVGAGYAAVNAAALWLFLRRPFAAPDGSVGRFMW